RRRFIVLGVVGVLTAFFGYFAAQTQLVTSFGELLPQNHPFIQIAHKYDQYFGSVNNVTIMIEAKEGTIYNTAIIGKIVQMTRDMDLVYGIQHGSVRSVKLQLFPAAGRRRDCQYPGAAQRRHSQERRRAGRTREQRPQKSRRDLRPLRLARRQGGGDRGQLPRDATRLYAHLRRDSADRGGPGARRVGAYLLRRAADPLRMGVSLHAGISVDFCRHGARRLDPALSLFQRLARSAAADDLRRDLRHLGPRLHPPARLRTRSAGARYPVPDNRARRQPFSADARSVLRRVLPAAR